jgi:pimeloyl-[acyl-carrier protein] methyl ester esterase
MAQTKIAGSSVHMSSVAKNLVLLPGLDGTGQLFAGFLAALPDTFIATAVAYPTNDFLSYTELRPFVAEAVPRSDPFVLLAESYSTPVALAYATSNPPNLAAVIISTGFVFKPVGGWSQLAKAIAQPWFFRMNAPSWVLECALIGRGAPPALIQKLHQVLQLVSPAVLSGRVNEALNCDARSDLARITVPLLYLQAAHDRMLSESCAREMKRIRPETSFALVDGPHLLLQREPQRVADIVSAFVQEL